MKLELSQSLRTGQTGLRPRLAAPEAPTRPAEAPTRPAEAPTEAPAPSSPRPDEGGREKEGDSEPDIDEQIKRIIREMPDPTPQPGGE